MKLVDLIPYLDSEQSLDALYTKESLNRSSETILIYFQDELKIESDLVFFDYEETDDKLVFIKNGTTYIQLFPLGMALELMSMLDLQGKNLPDQQIAQRLFEYRINDA